MNIIRTVKISTKMHLILEKHVDFNSIFVFREIIFSIISLFSTLIL